MRLKNIRAETIFTHTETLDETYIFDTLFGLFRKCEASRWLFQEVHFNGKLNFLYIETYFEPIPAINLFMLKLFGRDSNFFFPNGKSKESKSNMISEFVV